jgi:hypothetical protein
VRSTQGEADEIELLGGNCPQVGDCHRAKMPAPL